jgi:hypothetical protein
MSSAARPHAGQAAERRDKPLKGTKLKMLGPRPLQRVVRRRIGTGRWGPLGKEVSGPSFDGVTPSRGGESDRRRHCDEGGSNLAGARRSWLAAEVRLRKQERGLKLRALKSGNQCLFFHRLRAEKRTGGRDGARMRRMLVLPDAVQRRLTDSEFSGAAPCRAGG